MDIAMLHRGCAPHPSHQGFAEAINADIIGLDKCEIPIGKNATTIPEEVLSGIFSPNYDLYIAEGTRSLYGALSKQIFQRSKLIYLSADQALYDLQNQNNHLNSIINNIIANYGMFALSYLFNKYIDGIIAVSDFTLNYTRPILTETPARIAHPYIQPKVFRRLGSVKPNLKSNTAITVGGYAPYKGQDLLVNAWDSVRDVLPSAELKLVGTDYPSHFEKMPGITVCGYVEDLGSELASASLYIQPSRADSYPVSVLEALRAGLPTLVTETTGNWTEAQRLADNLVVKPDSNSIASGIIDYFNRSVTERRQLSKMARNRGSKYDPTYRKKCFRREFLSLKEEIY